MLDSSKFAETANYMTTKRDFHWFVGLAVLVIVGAIAYILIGMSYIRGDSSEIRSDVNTLTEIVAEARAQQFQTNNKIDALNNTFDKRFDDLMTAIHNDGFKK